MLKKEKQKFYKVVNYKEYLSFVKFFKWSKQLIIN